MYNVTALAQAGVAKQIKPVYQTGLSYTEFGIQIGLYPPDFVDDATASQMAGLLSATVVKLQPRALWTNGQVNTSQLANLPLQNFVAFTNMPNAPSPDTLMVVNGGDLAQACTQSEYFMPEEEFIEQELAYLIPGATMSPDATAALPTSYVSTWPPQPVYWYTPPAATAPKAKTR